VSLLGINAVVPDQFHLAPYPLVVRWNEGERPLPVRTLRSANSMAMPMLMAPPWLVSGPVDQPFDFCGQVRRLVEDIVSRCPELNHIQVPRLLLAITVARNGRQHGLQARVTPLRFSKGQLTKQRRGVTYQVQRLFLGDHEFLYLMTFCLPRFLNQSFDDKFITLFHELYHISPGFDGDLRRHEGRYGLHTHSQRHYDGHMAELARTYLAGNPPADLHGFMRLNFAQLCHRHGGVNGIVVARPKVYPVFGNSSPCHP
jgi:predicted metallopeptidase